MSIFEKNEKKKKEEKGCSFYKYTALCQNNFKNTFLKILGPAIEYSQAIKDVEHILNFHLIFMPPWPQWDLRMCLNFLFNQGLSYEDNNAFTAYIFLL